MSPAHYKAQLAQFNQRQANQFANEFKAYELIAERALFIDDLLQTLWCEQFHLNTFPTISLIALGGYGRKELHPYSDIDVLILIPETINADCRQQLEIFITCVWDIGLELSHSVRNIENCISDAKIDLDFATNLLENRLIAGVSTGIDTLNQAIQQQRIWLEKDFFLAKQAEQTARYKKFNETAYNLEPNIKNGPGGLRDIHMIAWITKQHFSAEKLEDLVKHQFLTRAEFNALDAGRNFLWKVRFALHLLTGRKEDRVLFDYQKQLATNLGYVGNQYNLGVENFMRDYYRCIKSLRELNDMLLQLFREATLNYDKNNITPINDRFQICNHYIEVRDPKCFAKSPEALLEIFFLMAQDPNIKGVRANTIRLIRQSRHLVNNDFRNNPNHNQIFLNLLQLPGNIYRSLLRMNRYGVLGKYIPPFERIIGQMQYDLFHVYTVDQHSLFMIRNLYRFTQTAYAEQFPLCHKIINQLSNLEIVYLAGLFHDIAKARGGDHSALGAQDIREFAKRISMNEKHIQIAEWLVRQHLIMSLTAQKKDIHDPSVIAEFGQQVDNKTRLDYLYLLTVADINATNPALWNNWKNSLLRQLYESTCHYLSEKRRSLSRSKLIEIKQNKALAAAEKYHLPTEPIQMLWQNFDDGYFLRESVTNILWHSQGLLQHDDNNGPLIQIKEHLEHGATEIFIYKIAHPKHFAITTTVLAQHDLNICEARISRSKDGHSLDSYVVTDQYGTAMSDVDVLENTRRELLYYHLNVAQPPQLTHRRLARTLRYFQTRTKISFSQFHNPAVTIVEVETANRPGLLARIANAFVEAKVRIQNAKIVTIGEHVEDVFFITDQNDAAITDPAQQETIRAYLNKHLDG